MFNFDHSLLVLKKVRKSSKRISLPIIQVVLNIQYTRVVDFLDFKRTNNFLFKIYFNFQHYLSVRFHFVRRISFFSISSKKYSSKISVRFSNYFVVRAKFFPPSYFLIFRNGKERLGAKSGKYGGCESHS